MRRDEGMTEHRTRAARGPEPRADLETKPGPSLTPEIPSREGPSRMRWPYHRWMDALAQAARFAEAGTTDEGLARARAVLAEVRQCRADAPEEPDTSLDRFVSWVEQEVARLARLDAKESARRRRRERRHRAHQREVVGYDP